MTNEVQRETMEYDVVIIGAGPSGLSTSIKIKQLDPNINICILEKSSEVGAHILSGNIFETSIEDVWTNESYEHYRSTLKKGRRDLLQMCRKCNKDGCKSEEERGIGSA